MVHLRFKTQLFLSRKKHSVQLTNMTLILYHILNTVTDTRVIAKSFHRNKMLFVYQVSKLLHECSNIVTP